MRRTAYVLTIVAVVSAGMASVAAAQPTVSEEAAAVAIAWQPCPGAPGFECAQVRVPLDYDEPSGPQIHISVARLPAGDQGNKIGSIFLNPGGPGGSGVDFLMGAGPFLFTDEVRQRFDLIGFDPRGIMGSTPLLCFDHLEESFEVLPPFAFPMSRQEQAIEMASTELLADACGGGDLPIRDHMSTADVARDMDQIRAMLGEETINYAGYSYGSFLGNVYANLFPDRVRSLVIDGVLNPVDWTTGDGNEALTLPFSTRLNSDIGAQDTLDEFFRLCDEAGPAGCAFAPDSSARFDALADRLLRGPIEIIDPIGGPFLFTYADLIASTLGPLYDSFSWPFHAEFLAFLEANADPVALGEALRATIDATGFTLIPALAKYPNFVEGFPGVACSDSNNPNRYRSWPLAGAAADAANGYFGRIWTHASVPCWNWPGASDDRYAGPFTTDTANTVLVVSTTFDPATPLHGAVAVNSMLPDSALLTVEGWGHTSLFLSACADAAIADYFLTAVAPADGTVCTQDFAPFPVAAAAAERADAEVSAERRRDAMEEVALRP